METMTFEPDITIFRPDRPGIRKVLGDLEAEIMELIWQQPVQQGTMVRDVFEVLYSRRRIAYTTVMNTMSRLAKKKLLRVETREHAYIYYPLWTEQEFISRFVGRILEDLLVSFSGATLEGLSTLQSPEALAQARSILGEITRQRMEEEK
jgi:predicted transcriptional regulator